MANILNNISALPFPQQTLFYFSLILRNISDEKSPLVVENPISNFLLSNRQAKTVLKKRVKRQWSQRVQDRVEYYEKENEAPRGASRVRVPRQEKIETSSPLPSCCAGKL